MALVRKLRDFRWELRGHKVALVDIKGNKEIEIDKVRLMSFMKFAPNCLDKMRIEDTKLLRAKIQAIRKAQKDKKAIHQKSLFDKTE